MKSTSDSYAVSMVSCGRDHTLALLSNGKVIGWGGDGSGRIPAASAEYCTSPAPTHAVEVLLQVPLSAIAAGEGISLGVTRRREMIAWGTHGAGIGGVIGAIAPATPLPIGQLSRIRVAAAAEFQCAAIDEDGALSTWGLNLDGALGRKDAAHEAPPGCVGTLPPALFVSIGKGFMLAGARDGA